MTNYPEWAKPGSRVVCRIHGPGYITTVGSGVIGVHFDSNKRDRNTDCWFIEKNWTGEYERGNGRDLLRPEPSNA